MEVLSFEVTGKPAASNIFINTKETARRSEVEQKLEFLAIFNLDWKAVSFCSEIFSLAGNLNSLAIDRECRQIHLPHATSSSHAQSLHRTDDMCSLAQGAWGLKTNCLPKTFTHPRVMFHLAPHSTMNTSTSSLSPTSPVLLSSSSPNPDLLSTHPFVHCEDPPQDGTSTEFHSFTDKEENSGKRSQILCRNKNCNNPSWKFWHLPVCLNCKSEKRLCLWL